MEATRARASATGSLLYWPDWSPDGERMALITLYICDGDKCMDVVTRRLDGSGGTHLVGSDQGFTRRVRPPIVIPGWHAHCPCL